VQYNSGKHLRGSLKRVTFFYRSGTGKGTPLGPNRVQTERVGDNCACVKRGVFILLACCPCASALNPSLDINQYAHNSWTVREAFFKSGIQAIAQTPDGYLWLGTEFGLLRFDGVKADAWQPPAGEHLPSSNTQRLLVARDGRLWIGTREGIASWKDGKLTNYPGLAGLNVEALLEDREGTIWAGATAIPTGRLCAIQRGITQCYGEDGSLGLGVNSLYEDGGGSLYAGAATGLWRWKPGNPKLYSISRQVIDINALIESDSGALWMAMPDGIRQLVHGKVEAYPHLRSGGQFRPDAFLRDRDGGLWIGTADQGILHVHRGRTDVFAQSDGLSADFIYNLFEDREGNMWVATRDGLDRFRDVAVPTVSVKQGLSNATVVSVLAATDGSVWLGTNDGLNRWKDGRNTIYRKRSSGLPDNRVASLLQDNRGRIWVSTLRGIAYLASGRFIHVGSVPDEPVHSIAGDSIGNLWISLQDQGLFHLHEGSVVKHIPWARLGRKDNASALFSDPAQGGLWLGFLNGGIAYLKDGQVRASYSSANALGAGYVKGLHLDRDGALWAATQSGLSRVKNGRIATLTSSNGLPCDTVHWAMEDNDNSFWLYMACGLVRVARSELDAWVATANQNPRRHLETTLFDASDGVRSH